MNHRPPTLMRHLRRRFRKTWAQPLPWRGRQRTNAATAEACPKTSPSLLQPTHHISTRGYEGKITVPNLSPSRTGYSSDSRSSSSRSSALCSLACSSKGHSSNGRSSSGHRRQMVGLTDGGLPRLRRAVQGGQSQAPRRHLTHGRTTTSLSFRRRTLRGRLGQIRRRAGSAPRQAA